MNETQAQKTAEDLVLAVLRAPLARRWFVADLATATGMGPDTLYPALVRLERSGRVLSGWLPGPFPRRHWYQIAEVECKLCDDSGWVECTELPGACHGVEGHGGPCRCAAGRGLLSIAEDGKRR